MKPRSFKSGRRGMAKARRARGGSAAKAGPSLRVPLKELHIHPLLKNQPTMSGVVEQLRALVKTSTRSTRADAVERLAEREPEWKAFVADVAARGIQDPLVVEKRAEGGWWVKDGTNRLAAGLEAGRVDAPVRLSSEDPARVRIGSLAARRHVSKELLAYVALDCYPSLVREGEGRPAKNAETDSDCPFSTLAELADYIGVHTSTVKTAARVHRMFRNDAEAREKYEWRLYAGAGFQGILAGTGAEVAGGKNNGRSSLAASEQLRQFFQGMTSRVLKQWTKAEAESAEARAELKADMSRAIATLPDGAVEVVAHAIKHRRAILADIAGEKGGEP